MAHTIDYVCSKINNSWFNPWFSFYFSSLCPAPYIEWYMCWPIQIEYLNFKAVLALPNTARSARTHKSISFIWIVWSTLYVYLCEKCKRWRLLIILLAAKRPPSMSLFQSTINAQRKKGFWRKFRPRRKATRTLGNLSFFMSINYLGTYFQGLPFCFLVEMQAFIYLQHVISL